jgi:hypothetical protein
MRTLAPGSTAESLAGTAGSSPAKRLIMVVGYDGSAPARGWSAPRPGRALVVPKNGQSDLLRITASRNSNKEGIMTETDRQTVQAQTAFDRRLVLEDVKARLSAISDTLSISRIDVGQLRQDIDELTAITRRITWLADISTPRPLRLKPGIAASQADQL